LEEAGNSYLKTGGDARRSAHARGYRLEMHDYRHNLTFMGPNYVTRAAVTAMIGEVDRLGRNRPDHSAR
jgi:hypothetical protein